MTHVKLGPVRAFPNAQPTARSETEGGGAMTDSRCADCAHCAQWPERVAFVRESMQTVPETYPTLACMQSPTKALAKSEVE